MEQLNLDLLVRMSKGAVFMVLAWLFVDVALAVFSLVARRVIKLLNLIVRIHTASIAAVVLRALHVRVRYSPGVPTLVTLVVVEVAACEFMPIRLTMRAQLCLEGFQVEPKELILAQHLSLLVVEGTAEESVGTRVVVAFRSFILEWMIGQFVHIVGSAAVLPRCKGTSWLQWQISEGWYLNVSAR